MKKVLVVGGCGYIGGLVVDNLIQVGHDVTVYDNLLYEERFLKPVKFIFGCITDTERLVSIANKFDVVVWLAALVGDPACEIDVQLTQKINYESVKNFCEGLDLKIPIIFYSTCSVYGVSEGILDEDSPVNPLSSYASTKYAAEKHILERSGTIFRLGTVFGLSDTYSRIRLDLVVNVMTMKAFLDKEITVNGGEQWRPIISVIDIARYTIKCVNKPIPGVFILSYKNVTIKELGEEISKITGVKLVYNDLPYQDHRNYMVNSSKAEKAFDYKPTITVEHEVNRIYNIISEGRIKDLNLLRYHNGQYLRNQLETIGAKI
jgi:nucleoside-diphosphate-sugar epimerase